MKLTMGTSPTNARRLTMFLEVLKYEKTRNVILVRMPDGKEVYCDPFVGCAYDMTDFEYASGKAYELEGKFVDIEDDFEWFQHPHLGREILPWQFKVIGSTGDRCPHCDGEGFEVEGDELNGDAAIAKCLLCSGYGKLQHDLANKRPEKDHE